MNPDQAALLMVARLLERLAIPYMVTGSVASSYHGRPRSTHDVDVVIDPDADQLERLVLGLTEAGYYVDAQRAREALRSRRQFNAIEMQSASKIDLIVCKDRPFSRAELARRQPAELAVDLRVSLASAEDVLLSKLEWAKLAGGSERQIEDARGVLALNAGLDRAYVSRWAAQLGIADLWQQLNAGGG